MSDLIEGREPMSRRARRQQARQKSPKDTQVSNPSRRSFLIGAAGTIASLTGLAGAYSILRSNLKEYPQTDPFSIENLSNERIDYKAKVIELNNEINRNPNRFQEIAPRIANLAIIYFSREMGYDPRSYIGKLSFHWDEDFKKKRDEMIGCIETGTNDDGYAFVQADTQEIVFNSTLHLYGDFKNKNPLDDSGLLLFTSTIHELHHLSSPIIDIVTDGKKSKLRGFGILISKEGGNKPGLVCYDTYRIALEEAVVQDSTNRMLSKLNIPPPPASPQYKLWVERYQENIVNKLFQGDYQKLLKLHQSSDSTEFFRLIGEKLGAPSRLAVLAGQQYTDDILQKGKS